MKTEPPNAAAAEFITLPEKRRSSRVLRRMLKISFAVLLPLILIPTLMPRRVSAKKLSGSEAPKGSTARGSVTVRETQIQDLVNKLKIRMSIPDTVVVSIVEHNALVVSVERAKDGSGAFSLSIARDFLDGLTTDEINAVVAHELGHVWIFTHHPFLQTEELANQIAMQVVPEDTLSAVYDKVWKRVGHKGNLVYLPPAAGTSSARQSQ
jgi:peptidase M48-like protein